jgi:hypothetical protein
MNLADTDNQKILNCIMNPQLYTEINLLTILSIEKHLWMRSLPAVPIFRRNSGSFINIAIFSINSMSQKVILKIRFSDLRHLGTPLRRNDRFAKALFDDSI